VVGCFFALAVGHRQSTLKKNVAGRRETVSVLVEVVLQEVVHDVLGTHTVMEVVLDAPLRAISEVYPSLQ
jgi:hypothetical protein